MSEIIERRSDLPAKLDELSKFVLIGREKLIAVRAEIRAIDKVGLATEVRQQKLREAQDISEAVLDAEVRIGELMAKVPKATNGGANQYQAKSTAVSQKQKKTDELHDSNATKSKTANGGDKQSEQFKNDNSIEAEKAKTEPLQVNNDVGLGCNDDEEENEDNTLNSEPTAQPEIKAERPKTKAEIVKETGFTQKQVERFQTLAAHPEIVAQAKAEARENDDIVSRSLVLEKVKQKKREESRQQWQETIKEQVAAPKTDNHVDIFTTDKKYRVIYADPPWSYGDKQNIEGLGGAVKHYPTMPLKDICELPVPSEDNAVLFLWVTSPLLEDSFKVINAWGFKYKSSFIWDKVAHNMGHYNSVRHELLLICTKGSCTPDVPKLFDSVVSIERTEHSKKPNEFREMIDTLYPKGNRIELFAREAPKGWDVWGNMA